MLRIPETYIFVLRTNKNPHNTNLSCPKTQIETFKAKKRPHSTHVFDSVLPLVERVYNSELIRSCEVD